MEKINRPEDIEQIEGRTLHREEASGQVKTESEDSWENTELEEGSGSDYSSFEYERTWSGNSEESFIRGYNLDTRTEKEKENSF